jgi:hypothetical protein
MEKVGTYGNQPSVGEWRPHGIISLIHIMIMLGIDNPGGDADRLRRLSRV